MQMRPAHRTIAQVALFYGVSSIACEHAPPPSAPVVATITGPVAIDAGSAASPPQEGAETSTVEPMTDIAELHPRLVRCFDEGRKTNPKMKGSLHVKLSLQNHVRSASVENVVGISNAVVECIRKTVLASPLVPPGSDDDTIDVPVSVAPLDGM